MRWEKKPLEEVADFSLGKMLDKNKNRGEMLSYLANVNVRWGGFDLENLRQMRFEPAEIDRYGLRFGDIVMCEGGEPGRCAVWKDQVPGMMIQKALHRIRPHACLDHRYLYYSFLRKGKSSSNEFAGLFTGSTIKHLPREKLAKVEVDVPPLPVQGRIADILCSYDDLIENNRRQIKLLEEAARLLYREWFVHFRFPGHEHVRTIDGIPEGWQITKLGVCSAFKTGGTPRKSKAEYWAGDIPWISSGELTRMRIGEADLNVTSEAVESGSRYAYPNTILAVVRGMSLAKEFRIGLVSRLVCFNQDVKAIVPGPKIEGIFLFHILDEKRDRIRQMAGEASHGTKKLETPVLQDLPIVLPPPLLQSLFVEHVQPMNSLWDCLFNRNRKLAEARDFLLPRLMSGEIAV